MEEGHLAPALSRSGREKEAIGRRPNDVEGRKERRMEKGEKAAAAAKQGAFLPSFLAFGG